MRVYLGVPRGFCAGVDRAIDVVDLALERFGPPVYVKHQIVHNPHVVNALEEKGAVTVEDVEDIPEGASVVFSAHGSPPEDFQKARSRNLNVIDATCPLVTKVHNEARKYSREGQKIILVGHRGHQEVKGTMGQTGMTLLDDREEIDLPGWDESSKVTVLTQTTLSVDDTQRSIEAIGQRFSNLTVRNDLCYATTNRQGAVKELCKLVDLVLVIGAQNSSNCMRLREVAEANGVTSYLINGPEELDPAWLEGVEAVGVTSGASTPEVMVQKVVDTLQPEEVITIEGADEDISFVLPPEFRQSGPADELPRRQPLTWRPQMNITLGSLISGAREARGTAIIIDVFRAFTTAAVAFSRGAREIVLVGTPPEALELRDRGIADLCMGEVRGMRPEGFDFGNSPYELSLANVEGKTLAHSTMAGTVGVTEARGAEEIYLGSLVLAEATAQRLLLPQGDPRQHSCHGWRRHVPHRRGRAVRPVHPQPPGRTLPGPRSRTLAGPIRGRDAEVRRPGPAPLSRAGRRNGLANRQRPICHPGPPRRRPPHRPARARVGRLSLHCPVCRRLTPAANRQYNSRARHPEPGR